MNYKYSGNRWPCEQQLLLLQASLLEGPPALEAWHKWKQRIDFDKIDPASFKLLPLLSRNPSLQSLQDPIFEKCKGVYRRVWVENQILWKKMISVLSALLQQGVGKVVLLKGMAMILQYYQDFGTRVIGDIDILVDRSEARKVDAFLKSTGWKPSVSCIDLSRPNYLTRWYSLGYIHTSEMNLDMHWSFIQENSRSLDEAIFRDCGEFPLENISLHIPCPGDLLLQACIHGVKYSPVPLIRWVADAMTILKKEEGKIDWDRLVDLASKAHVCMPLSLALNYLIEKFQAAIPKDVIGKLQSTASMRLEYIEYRANAHFFTRHIAAWARYCLQQGHMTIQSQLVNILNYLQFRAKLTSKWHIPFFGVYWILKAPFVRRK